MTGVQATVPAFPLEVLPPRLRRFTEEAAASVGAPVDHAATAMLAVASAAIGSTRVARVKRDHVEYPVMYAAIVAGPGQGKSPLIATVAGPAWRQETQAHDQWKADRESLADGQPQPPQRHYVLSDLTLEALPEVLTAQPRGVLFYMDELSGWVASMDKYRPSGKGSDLQAWLSIWNASPLTSKRARRDAIHVRRPFVSVLGGIQPDMLGQLATGPGNTIRQDGFIDRIMFSYPDAPSFVYTEDELSAEAEGDWARAVTRLYQLEHDDQGDGALLGMTPDALEAYRAWSQRIMTAAADAPETLHGRYGKVRGIAARFALTIQMLAATQDLGSWDQLELRAVQAGIHLAEYYTRHALRAYAQINASDVENAARRLLEWMHRKGYDAVTPRQVLTAQVAGVKKVDHVHALMDYAAQMDWGERVDISQGDGKSVTGFRRVRRTI